MKSWLIPFTHKFCYDTAPFKIFAAATEMDDDTWTSFTLAALSKFWRNILTVQDAEIKNWTDVKRRWKNSRARYFFGEEDEAGCQSRVEISCLGKLRKCESNLNSAKSLFGLDGGGIRHSGLKQNKQDSQFGPSLRHLNFFYYSTTLSHIAYLVNSIARSTTIHQPLKLFTVGNV